MRKLLSVAGILIDRALSALFKQNKASEARRVPIEQNPPLITSGWNYRPKKAIRRCTAIQNAETEATDLVTPNAAKDENDNVSFDDRWLEFAAHPSVNGDNVDAKVEQATMKGPSSDHESAVSAYDQSPIDERSTLLQDGRQTKEKDYHL
jgi:hypothetical protein